MAGIAGETLVNLWLKAEADKKPQKLPMTMFFNSKARKKWSKDFNYDWKDYKRFHEQFKHWIKIFTARARKKKQLEELSRIRKRNELIAACVIGAVLFGVGSYLSIYFFVQQVG